MHPLSTASATSFLFTLLLFSHITAWFPSNDASNLPNCNQTFSCGDLTNITYPFTGGQRPSYCGPPEFHTGCSSDLTTTLPSNSLPYQVTQVDQTSQTLRLSLVGLYSERRCIDPFKTTTFDDSSFSLVPNHSTLSLFYGCENLGDFVMANFKFSCPGQGYSEKGFFMIGDPVPGTAFMYKCQSSFQVPFLRSWVHQLEAKGSSLLVEVLKEGFDVSYSNPYSADCQKCNKHSGGQCGFDGFDGKPIFICNDQLCPEKSPNRKKLIIGVSLASGAVLVIFVGGWVMLISFELLPSIANSKSGIDKSRTYFGVRVFSYNELEEATNCFDSSKQLGDGGFGTVYHGLLRDGREVAVKRLYESNMRRAVQFMNEIEILAQLRHRNLDFVVREMVTSVAELAFRCLQYEREMRPTMEEVVEELRGIERENYGAGKGEIEYQGR
ncbi:LEAF RUST 10 DISEASE-RESISTANCE LOCUS RECEPTOR-LIKE PROTEIN KINASE-LIKE 1.4 [Salix koriyanagi]|uniref:non-specific serine/threonine protein kinase n=1 Tax=Salix koriyanagi TaxID=2511006 RepID=A0A9Q0ZL53_9ROSI|nr:LEAF RUST 10 DISEASE-RESISTANCE LOCUS RECEPTOR-LIKE PROTEIN KINASE-LIKE 1.4 [Salix koriyanagi]